MIWLPAALAALSGIFYFLLFRRFAGGWNKLREFRAAPQPPQNHFSIIIPCRNEAQNLPVAVESILRQNYSSQYFEILICDDHSTDSTVAIARLLEETHENFVIRILESPGEGKKSALKHAIEQSRYEWIITTDADCERGPHWLRTLDSFIGEYSPEMVSMPVMLVPRRKTFFQRSQALEFLGLVGIGGASIRNGEPNMCNGANLCYRKEAFLECGGFDGIKHTASGDDELLMHRVFAIWPDGVKFLKSREAVVTTAPAATIGDFLSQRKRWVSKSRLYERKGITWVMMGCYLFNLALLVSFVAGFFMPGAWVLLLLLLTLKLSGEYLFLKKVTTFFGQEQLMRPFAAGSLLHIFYVLLIGIYGNFGRYNWKGRRLK